MTTLTVPCFSWYAKLWPFTTTILVHETELSKQNFGSTGHIVQRTSLHLSTRGGQSFANSVALNLCEGKRAAVETSSMGGWRVGQTVLFGLTEFTSPTYCKLWVQQHTNNVATTIYSNNSNNNNNNNDIIVITSFIKLSPPTKLPEISFGLALPC